jgi:hypothetical protein
MIFGVLISLDNLVIGHNDAVLRAFLFVPNASMANGMEVVKLKTLLLGGLENLDGDRHQTESDVSLPDGSHNITSHAPQRKRLFGAQLLNRSVSIHLRFGL